MRDAEGQAVHSRLDEHALRQLAEATGGAYAALGPSGRGLETLYREHLAQLPRHTVAERMKKVYTERFQIPLAVGDCLPAPGARGRGTATAVCCELLRSVVPIFASSGPPRRAGAGAFAAVSGIGLALFVTCGEARPSRLTATTSRQRRASPPTTTEPPRTARRTIRPLSASSRTPRTPRTLPCRRTPTMISATRAIDGPGVSCQGPASGNRGLEECRRSVRRRAGAAPQGRRRTVQPQSREPPARGLEEQQRKEQKSQTQQNQTGQRNQQPNQQNQNGQPSPKDQQGTGDQKNQQGQKGQQEARNPSSAGKGQNGKVATKTRAKARDPPDQQTGAANAPQTQPKQSSGRSNQGASDQDPGTPHDQDAATPQPAQAATRHRKVRASSRDRPGSGMARRSQTEAGAIPAP